MIFLVNYSIEKPRPDGLALAFQERKLSQSRDEAVNMAQPGLAYLDLAWPGLRPQAGPCTALDSVASSSMFLPFFPSYLILRLKN